MGRRISRILAPLFVALFVVSMGGQAGAAKKAPPGDPPGNNGTVKIKQSDPTDDTSLDKSNEPHGTDCRIWLAFFDFDQNQRAFIILTGQPPSAKKDTPVYEDKGTDGKGVVISYDPAGGGQDQDGIIYPVGLADAVKKAGLTEHPQQGYHLKLTVIVKDANGVDVPGATKHKVFWMAPCPAAPPPVSTAASTLRIAKAQEGTGTGPFTFDLNCDHAPMNRTFTLAAGEKLDLANVPPGTTCAVTETDKKGATSTTVTEDPVTGAADDGTVKTSADKATIVTFKNVFPGTGSTPAPPDTDLRPAAGTTSGPTGGTGGAVDVSGTTSTLRADVLGQTATQPESTATLPRTGNDPRPLAMAGLWSLTAGGLALLAGRRLRHT